MFVVRCRFTQPDGVGYLDKEARCTSERYYAKTFDVEADAWAFAALSGERMPDDCWVEERLVKELGAMRITSTDSYVSVTVILGPLSAAVAEANLWPLEEGVWWICRVKVPEKAQGTGIGSKLLRQLVESVKDQKAKAIVVAPGGYGSDPKRQAAFYAKNGFKPSSEGLLRIDF